MTDKHSVTPSPELVEYWVRLLERCTDMEVFSAAARWGANEELEACCEWLEDTDCDDPQEVAEHLRTARRPKPPSLIDMESKTVSIGEWNVETLTDDDVKDLLALIRQAKEDNLDDEYAYISFYRLERKIHRIALALQSL